MSEGIDRRDALIALGTFAGSLAALPLVSAEEGQPHPLGVPDTYDWKTPGRPVSAAIMGAGNRGSMYARYAAERPNELTIVGVAEPIPYRNERTATAHGISSEYRWDTWERAFDRPSTWSSRGASPRPSP